VRGRVGRCVAVALGVGLATAAAGCGGDDDARCSRSRTGRPRAPSSPSETSCHFDGDRQVTAEGIVRNPGENTYYVNITVRFVDADGVRVDIGSDSISDLQPDESARWDAVIYSDDAGGVVGCEVTTEAS
jgi:hypothetical protein